MDINHMQRISQYSYQVDTDRIKQRLQREADKSGMADRPKSDSVAISEEGRNVLQEKMASFKREHLPGDMVELSALHTGVYGIMNDFEKMISEQEGSKTDTFDDHVNRMVHAYQRMKDQIEEKYAAPDGRKEYYMAEDGSMQELSREKELEMLDQAYETHSRFMAASTQIWNELQEFKAKVDVHSNGMQTKEPVANRQNADIREQAYHVFMTALRGENSEEQGQMSQEVRDILNGIWDSMRK